MNVGLWRRLPGNINLSMGCNTVSQIEIDETLIGDAFFIGHLFEVANNVFAQAHSDGFFELSRIRVFAGFHFGQIVFSFHSLIPW